MSGARLAILYGYVPCRLGLCGPDDAKKKKIITRFLMGEDSLERKVKRILREFKGAYPYYQLIASSNKINDPLDIKVVEAYWVGNSLLDKVGISDFKKMIKDSFVPLGKILEKKAENLPKNAIPFHNFHVLNIGSVTGRLKETQAELDICRVSWGKVRKTEKDNIVVLRQPLKFDKKISLGKPACETIQWDKSILPEIKKGDWISIHWNHAIQILSRDQLANIRKFTKKFLAS